jgi:hypothetical protein
LSLRANLSTTAVRISIWTLDTKLHAVAATL